MSVESSTSLVRGNGVMVVHVERVACEKAGCHESGTD